ncbi:MAG: outer membrane lipoprotein-sorting protein [Methylophaga sp.]|nr:outer membrane lipoprotein-sorting protein [Methylophaga sp.]
MKNFTKTSFIVASLLIPSLLFAADFPSGDEVAKQINARDEGVAVSRLLTMEMTDKKGKKRLRETRGFRKYYGNEKRTVIFYQSPRNIKDTAFLTYDYPEADRDDDQWLYLPAMRKVRRISASDRGDYFLGTDFTFEDIKLETRVSVGDYTFKTIGESEVDGKHCVILQSTPISKEISKELGYSKVEQCVDDEIWMVRQSKMWDVKGKPLKTLHISDIRQIDNLWTVHVMEVENHKTGHNTKFTFSDVSYDKGVNDSMFTKNSIKRGL